MVHTLPPVLSAKEVEMLANLLSRAAVSSYESIWANGVLNRLRVAATAPPPIVDTGGDDDDEEPTS